MSEGHLGLFTSYREGPRKETKIPRGNTSPTAQSLPGPGLEMQCHLARCSWHRTLRRGHTPEQGDPFPLSLDMRAVNRFMGLEELRTPGHPVSPLLPEA